MRIRSCYGRSVECCKNIDYADWRSLRSQSGYGRSAEYCEIQRVRPIDGDAMQPRSGTVILESKNLLPRIRSVDGGHRNKDCCCECTAATAVLKHNYCFLDDKESESFELTEDTLILISRICTLLVWSSRVWLYQQPWCLSWSVWVTCDIFK